MPQMETRKKSFSVISAGRDIIDSMIKHVVEMSVKAFYMAG
jgi:hypothetical protein